MHMVFERRLEFSMLSPIVPALEALFACAVTINFIEFKKNVGREETLKLSG